MNKLLSCHYNMDTNRVEARFTDGSAVAIDCIAIEDEYGNTPAQRAELDWLLYNSQSSSARCAGVLPYSSSMAMQSMATAEPSVNRASTRLVSML